MHVESIFVEEVDYAVFFRPARCFCADQFVLRMRMKCALERA